MCRPHRESGGPESVSGATVTSRFRPDNGNVSVPQSRLFAVVWALVRLRGPPGVEAQGAPFPFFQNPEFGSPVRLQARKYAHLFARLILNDAAQ
jgi:hypothetical protein